MRKRTTPIRTSCARWGGSGLICIALGIACTATSGAHADAIPGVGFVDGSVLVNGSASSPAGNSVATAPGMITPTTVTGGGSTGSGLVSGILSLDGSIIPSAEETFVIMSGSAEASQPAGYSGFATINSSFVTPAFETDPLLLSLPTGAFYAITNAGQQTVNFTAVTGTIGAGTLSAGTYRISFNFGVTISGGQTFVSKSLDWTLRLSSVPLTNLPADLNYDGAVDATDLALLLAAWGTPAADISGNGSTGAEDLAVILAAWG